MRDFEPAKRWIALMIDDFALAEPNVAATFPGLQNFQRLGKTACPIPLRYGASRRSGKMGARGLPT
jgi:hypothetical protein